MNEEIFGPLFPVITVQSPSDAVKFINDREKPLTLYVFAEDQKIQDAFAEQTSSGSMVMNDCLLQMGVDDLPFGGVGNSGYGAYHGQVKKQIKN